MTRMKTSDSFSAFSRNVNTAQFAGEICTRDENESKFLNQVRSGPFIRFRSRFKPVRKPELNPVNPV